MLFSQTYEREGNDSWLIDTIKLIKDRMGLYLEHKWNHNGWSGENTGIKIVQLDIDDIETSQKIVDEYLNDNSLNDEYPEGVYVGIYINLAKILEENSNQDDV